MSGGHFRLIQLGVQDHMLVANPESQRIYNDYCERQQAMRTINDLAKCINRAKHILSYMRDRQYQIDRRYAFCLAISRFAPSMPREMIQIIVRLA